MQSYTAFQNLALFVLRAIVAAVFIVAGYQKFSFWSGAHPEVTASMLTITKILSIVEPLGGVALILGFLTRWAAFGLTIIMIGAIYYLQFEFHIDFVMPTSAGWNFPLSLLGSCILLIAFGAGAWSIDAGRRRR